MYTLGRYTLHIKHLLWHGRRLLGWTQAENWVCVGRSSKPSGAGLWEGLGGLKGETKVSRAAGKISGAIHELTENVQHFNSGYHHTSVYELNARFVYVTINLN